jgi:hypothetical protein
MSIVCREKPKQAGDTFARRPSATREYWVSGTTERTQAILTVAATAPLLDQGVNLVEGLAVPLFRNVISIHEEGGGIWTASVKYESTPNTVDLAFTASAPSRKIYTSLETISTYSCLEDLDDGDMPDHKRSIGVTDDRVEGVDIGGATGVEFTVTRKWKIATMPVNYLVTLAEYGYENYVNHLEYTLTWMGQVLTFAKGSLRYRSVQAKWNSDGELEISSTLSFARPIIAADNFTVGFSSEIVKEGHQYLWIRYYDSVAGAKKVTLPWYVKIERVYRYANFANLEL